MNVDAVLNIRIATISGHSLTVGAVAGVAMVACAAWLSIRFMVYMVSRRTGHVSSGDGRYLSVMQLIRYVIWLIALAIILSMLGVDVTFLVASSAALLVGLGFGLQNVFQDFISGIILLVEGTIRVGDIVEVNGKVVKIKEISLRASSVQTRDDNIMIIPNHAFVQGSVLNWSHNLEPTRFSISVGVSYHSDVRLVEKVLVQCAETCSDIITAAGYRPFVRFSDFGDSALMFELIFWSNNLFRIENTKSSLRFSIVEAFNSSGIVIPFPQIVVHTS